MPETKGLTLEQLDAQFSIPTMVHARFGFGQCVYVIQHYVFRSTSAQIPNINLTLQDENDQPKEVFRPRKGSIDLERHPSSTAEASKAKFLS